MRECWGDLAVLNTNLRFLMFRDLAMSSFLLTSGPGIRFVRTVLAIESSY